MPSHYCVGMLWIRLSFVMDRDSKLEFTMMKVQKHAHAKAREHGTQCRVVGKVVECRIGSIDCY
ncbi:MAG: hypothetical protein ACKVH8_18900 [Pirellulales bacterium]